MRKFTSITSFVCAVGVASPTGAQSVRGVVRDHQTGAVVVNASVALEHTSGWRAETATDSTGVFSFERISSRVYQVHVSHPGFDALEDTVSVQPFEEVVLEVQLRKDPIQLGAIEVVGRRTEAFPMQAGFDQRRELYGKLGIGRFLTREDMEGGASGTAVDYLLRIPYIVLEPRTRQPLLRRFGITCVPSVYFDGQRIEGSEVASYSGGLPLEGIEVYRGAAQIPGTYSDPAGCGLILIWSRRDQDTGGISWLRGRRGVWLIAGFLAAGFLFVR